MKMSSFLGLLLAWVLWSELQNKLDSLWTPEAGFDTRDQCIEALDKQLEAFRGRTDVIVGSGAIRFKDYTAIYRCLPDTVDPRPRGKE